MALSITHPALRWAAPAAVVAIVLGAAVVTNVTADVNPALPARSAADLLVGVQNADVAGLSGTVTQSADLGLPDLPVQLGSQGSSSFTSLVSGTHTLRVWYSGDEQQRLAVQGTLGESDLIRNGSDVWTWASETNTATHYQLPSRPAGSATPEATSPESAVAALTPQQAADAALAAIDPTTTVTTDGTAQVAGRSAYELVLAPKADASLIGQVRIAIDAEQYVPLRVQVIARGADAPAFEVGFTQISFDVPGAEHFQFAPPPGATVTDSTADQGEGTGPAKDSAAPSDSARAADEPTIVGTGWTSVLVAAAPSVQAAATGDPSDTTEGAGAPDEFGMVLNSLPQVKGDWGTGRLLQSKLFSVLLTDDGRLIAGAVGPDQLYLVAGR
jgi:outer membrane lipoprotein-sorting protein